MDNEDIEFYAVRREADGWYLSGNGLIHSVLDADRFLLLSEAVKIAEEEEKEVIICSVSVQVKPLCRL